MSKLHWMIVIPYYFFGALALLLLMMVLTRLVRAKLSINSLVMAAVTVSLGLMVLPLIVGWATLAEYTTRQLVILAAVSFALAAVDVLLQTWLPLPLDRELEEL